MNTRALKCFIEVYEKKSVAAAAREIFISPQGLSKIIKQLEYDLETELFFRGAQGMEATEAGELLYARARHIIYLLDDIKKEIGILGGSKATLHVVLTYAAAAVISYERLHAFTELSQNVQIKIDEYPDEYPMGSLFQDEADVGILLGKDEIANCNAEMLVKGRIALLVAADHEFAARGQVSLADLQGVPLVLKATEPGRESPLLEACRKNNIQPDIRFTSGNLAAMRNSCLNSGMVVEACDIVEKAFPDPNIVMVKVTPAIDQSIFLVSRNRDIQNRAVTQFQKYIKENLNT